MQRDGDDEFRLRDELRPGERRHHPPERSGEVEPVAVFEALHQHPGGLVVMGDGAGAPEDRRVGDRGGRQERRAQVDGEGRSEALAKGSFDEAQTRPAPGAERIGHARRGMASDAGRGIEKIERGSSQRREGAERKSHGAETKAVRAEIPPSCGEVARHHEARRRCGVIFGARCSPPPCGEELEVGVRASRLSTGRRHLHPRPPRKGEGTRGPE